MVRPKISCIAERARFYPKLIATAVIVGFIYPFFEGIAWNQHFGVQAWIKSLTGAEFHDFSGSIVVHAVGGVASFKQVLQRMDAPAKFQTKNIQAPLMR